MAPKLIYRKVIFFHSILGCILLVNVLLFTEIEKKYRYLISQKNYFRYYTDEVSSLLLSGFWTRFITRNYFPCSLWFRCYWLPHHEKHTRIYPPTSTSHPPLPFQSYTEKVSWATSDFQSERSEKCSTADSKKR